VAFLIRSLACTYYGGYHIEPHAHGWGQLIYAATGVMRVRAGGTLWIVPPARAVWAPAGARHEIWARGDFAMRTLYLDQALTGPLPAECSGLEVSPLLRELILHVVGLGMLSADAPAHERLAGLIVDQLAAAPTLPLSLPLPSDPRAARLAERLRDEPACELELDALARDAGASARTLQRLFLQETGLRFGEWRQRLRLLHAAGLLGAGVSVTEAGLEAGYSGSSAFIAAFRRQFGCTPARMR
jgi:AraC-like DNA-binding protein